MLDDLRLEGLGLPVVTARLVLRRFVPADFAAFADWHRRAEVYRYLYQPPPEPEAVRAKFAAALQGPFASDGDELRLAVTPRQGGSALGQVKLRIASRAALQGEIGYIFHPDAGGRGYATEAVAALLDFGFAECGFHRLFARLDPENRGSVGVVERLGLRCEAHFRQNDRFAGRWGDEMVYAVLRGEWEERRARAAVPSISPPLSSPRKRGPIS